MISILVTLIVLGVILYIVGLIPMDNTLRRIIQALAILFVCLYLLQIFGLWSGLPAGLRR
jgi:hypothetical protein